MRLFLLLIFASGLYCVEMDIIKVELPEKFTTERIRDKESNIVRVFGPQKVEFDIEINEKNNAYINCFCAPLSKYEKIKINGQEAIRLVMEMGNNRSYTLKIRGQTSSISIHYSTDSIENYESVKKIAESIVLKNEEKSIKMGLR